jgi:hypothetical protein
VALIASASWQEIAGLLLLMGLSALAYQGRRASL